MLERLRCPEQASTVLFFLSNLIIIIIIVIILSYILSLSYHIGGSEE